MLGRVGVQDGGVVDVPVTTSKLVIYRRIKITPEENINNKQYMALEIGRASCRERVSSPV